MENSDKMINVKIEGFNVVIRTDGEMPSEEATLRIKKTMEDLKYKERGLYEDLHS